jgi:RNA polymerase sigma factor (sigma-70 family)
LSVRRSDDPALAAIETVYRERYGSFLRLALAITRDEGLARDAVHDGFVRAVRFRSGLRSVESAPGWISRIVVNEATKRFTDESRYVPLDPDRVEAASSNGHEEGRVPVAAILALPERQRLVLFLRYYLDLDYAGIAQALGIRVGTVSATLHAAHRSLGARLTEEERCET